MIRDLSGQKFGRLSVVEYAGADSSRKAMWICRCDCGNVIKVRGNNLSSGGTQSCGCYKRDATIASNRKLKKGKAHHVTHGLSRQEHRLYEVWCGIKARCECVTNKRYSDYGGRGIALCDEWRDFGAFAAWAYNNGYDNAAPRGECTIDRINNDGDYCPANCRWVDMKTQRLNQRRVKHEL